MDQLVSTSGTGDAAYPANIIWHTKQPFLGYTSNQPQVRCIEERVV
jgi:hypothetical protein